MELGIIVESPELAERIAQQFEVLIQTQYSYRLELGPSEGDPVWIGNGEGKEVRYSKDPEAGSWAGSPHDFVDLRNRVPVVTLPGALDRPL